MSDSSIDNDQPLRDAALISSDSCAYVDRMYERFQHDSQSVSEDWRRLFHGDPWSATNGEVTHSAASERATHAEAGSNGSSDRQHGRRATAARQERVDELIRNYRVRGHIVADIDPLRQTSEPLPELDLSFYGFSEEDLDRAFSTRSSQGPNQRSLRNILDWLRNTYCRSIGVQFMHIDDLAVRTWLQNRMEGSENRIRLNRETQLQILRRLTEAVSFESFLQTKFAGAKSFSLEGAESLLPLLDLAIEKAGRQGVAEIVFGMAHRGRLNVLANIIGKRPREIFREFMDLESAGRTGPGDVKYHLGYSGDWKTTAGQKLHLSLCFNPSHLEFVNPVALGRVRAKQDRFGDTQRKHGLAILIHGDAAFAGEGVVQETLNLSELAGYCVGGALHVVVNDQIGFTTSPNEARSSMYATDVAKMLQIPIFHVNGEDPEAVAQAVELALDFRQEFGRDSVIDMYCYRRRGHNEGDEPSFTHPTMYRAIRSRDSVRESYLNRLLSLGGVTREDADELQQQVSESLNAEFTSAQAADFQLMNQTPTGPWTLFRGGARGAEDKVGTGVDKSRLANLLVRLSEPPAGFHIHPKLQRLLERRRQMAAGAEPIDWSTAEALAFASLAAEGHPVRLSGQDSQRGTFSQRHAVWWDFENGASYMPLSNVADKQAPVEILNSPLSEAGVLGFDYGYSLDRPEALVMWEAQFGDFANVAQVLIDQFLTSAETKWQRLSGLVLLLPHGFEGQGPEHSSARLERYLALAAGDNIQVVYPSTPSQYFHMLRRQVVRNWRKPLFVMTPKSLLRHSDCTSTLNELSHSRFHEVLPDFTADGTSHVVLCTGKFYYELKEHRQTMGPHGPKIIRLEQLYPLPINELHAAFAGVAPGTLAIWAQEEPQNMGAWDFVWRNWEQISHGQIPLACVARPASASPATGSKATHDKEQRDLLERALSGKPGLALSGRGEGDAN